MKLEVGKAYRMRNGEKVDDLEYNQYVASHPYSSKKHKISWKENGLFSILIHPLYDIISEWEEPMELAERVLELEKRIAQLEGAKEDKQESLNSVFYPKDGETYYKPELNCMIGPHAIEKVFTAGKLVQARIPAFRTKQAAKDCAEAFQVMLELRACDGVEEPITDKEQWCIIVNCGGTVTLNYYCSFALKLAMNFSQWFPTKELCQAAIDKVGADRILKAMKTLAGVKE